MANMPLELAQLLAQSQAPQVSTMPDPMASLALSAPAPIAVPKKKAVAPKRMASKKYSGQGVLEPEQYMQANPWGAVSAPPTQEEILDPVAASEAAPKPGLNPGMLRVPSIGVRPGEEAKDELRLERDTHNKTDNYKYLDQPKYDELVQMMANTPYIKDQEKGIGDLNDLFQKHAASIHTGVDISPLMALSDTWFGGNLAKSYKAPPSENDRNAVLAKYGELIQKQRQDLAKEVIGGVPKLRAGSSLEDTLQKFTQNMSAGIKNPPPPRQAQMNPLTAAGLGFRISDKVNTVDKDFQTKMNTLDEAKTAFQSGNLSEIRRHLGPVARLISMENGRLTEGDVSRVLPKDVEQTVEGLLTYLGMSDNNMTGPLIQALINDIDRAKTRYVSTYKGQMARMKQSAAGGVGGTIDVNPIFSPYEQQFEDRDRAKQEKDTKTLDALGKLLDRLGPTKR